MNRQELEPFFQHVKKNNSQGDIAMFGVSKNDIPIVGKWAKENNKKVYVFDSFEGLPEPETEDEKNPEFFPGISPKYKPGYKLEYKKGQQKTGMEIVEKIVIDLKLEDVFYLNKGYYEKTLRGREDNHTYCGALIDVDYPSSLNDVLDYVWDKIVKNGRIACHEAHQKNIVKVFNDRDIMCNGQKKKGDVPHHILATFYVNKV